VRSGARVAVGGATCSVSPGRLGTIATMIAER
jgi:hypothetical protein